jgi:predicted esterase
MCAIVAFRGDGREPEGYELITFLHGLESTVDDDLVPIGTKVKWLRERFPDLNTPALDTREAIALRDHCVEKEAGWFDDQARLEAAFSTPMAQARAAITTETSLVIGSSFGGAVLLRLIHEGHWDGPSLFLAGAGVKLTEHDSLPADHRALFIHGRRDHVVLLDDSRQLARSCGAPLWEVEDAHRLGSILDDGTLDAAIKLLLGGKS